MRTWPRKWQYYLDGECAEITHILLVAGDGPPTVLEQIGPQDLMLAREFGDKPGPPRYFCHHGDSFWLHPPPDKKYELRVGYQPHVGEV